MALRPEPIRAPYGQPRSNQQVRQPNASQGYQNNANLNRPQIGQQSPNYADLPRVGSTPPAQFQQSPNYADLPISRSPIAQTQPQPTQQYGLGGSEAALQGALGGGLNILQQTTGDALGQLGGANNQINNYLGQGQQTIQNGLNQGRNDITGAFGQSQQMLGQGVGMLGQSGQTGAGHT